MGGVALGIGVGLWGRMVLVGGGGLGGPPRQILPCTQNRHAFSRGAS